MVDLTKILASCDLVKVSSANESISNELLAALLATSDFYNHCLGYVNGTTVLHLGKKALHEYNLKIPNNTKTFANFGLLFSKYCILPIISHTGDSHFKEKS